MARQRHDDDFEYDDDDSRDGDVLSPNDGIWTGDDSETVPCPHCGKQIYEEVQQCPYCKYFVTEHDKIVGRKPLWFTITAFVCLFMTGGGLVLAVILWYLDRLASQ